MMIRLVMVWIEIACLGRGGGVGMGLGVVDGV